MPDNWRLAGDSQFWISVGDALSTVVKHDQYIVDFVLSKQAKLSHFSTRWQALSDDFDAKLNHFASIMPMSACSIGPYAEARSVLENFSQSVLTSLVAQTSFAQKYYKLVEDTLIEPALDCSTDISIDPSLWQQWQLWRNNLAYNQLGASFKLMFKLLSPDVPEGKWQLQVLLQSKQDPSLMIDLETYQTNKSKEKVFIKRCWELQ